MGEKRTLEERKMVVKKTSKKKFISYVNDDKIYWIEDHFKRNSVLTKEQYEQLKKLVFYFRYEKPTKKKKARK